jgi:hypothetical protein
MREGINWTSSEDKDKVAYVYTATFQYKIKNLAKMYPILLWQVLAGSIKLRFSIVREVPTVYLL